MSPDGVSESTLVIDGGVCSGFFIKRPLWSRLRLAFFPGRRRRRRDLAVVRLVAEVLVDFETLLAGEW